MKILTIVGARPQFIKAATVSRAIALHDCVSEVLVHTGQHYDSDMSDVFFKEMHIPEPDYHLGIGGGEHGQMTGRQLEAIERVLLMERPDWVLVYGDTNSTLAGALAGVKQHIPVAHVEAGLRSFNRRMPEEINRVLTDHASDLLFAPTDTAVKNLRSEGVNAECIEMPGDVMYDAAIFYGGLARCPDWFSNFDLREDHFILATVHRAENTANPARLRAIFEGLGRVGLPVVIPLHPHTRKRLAEENIMPAANTHIVPPVGYFEMAWLQGACRVIASDSGGVQKEAYFRGRRCVILREETEWVELVDAGWNVVVGADAMLIADALVDPILPEKVVGLYGRGDAAERIVRRMLQ